MTGEGGAAVTGQQLVANLLAEMEQLFAQLGELDTLESESEGNVDIVTLLRLALKSEVEAAEIAGLWISTTSELDAKAVFAQQCGDEMKHYQLLCQRLEALGEDSSSFSIEGNHSPLYHYLTTLHTTVERLAAGPFAREAVAEVRNRQFIDLCQRLGDEETARLYTEVIQPEEVHHHELGRDLLAKYATTAELQARGAEAARTSLAIADELRTLTEKLTGLHGIPVS
jgi:bacterioferritin (cytochrome b1)